MYPVSYYDLSCAGVPVHLTAFRPIDDAALCRNPFRIFTSLLRLELIETLRCALAAEICPWRKHLYAALSGTDDLQGSQEGSLPSRAGAASFAGSAGNLPLAPPCDGRSGNLIWR